MSVLCAKQVSRSPELDHRETAVICSPRAAELYGPSPARPQGSDVDYCTAELPFRATLYPKCTSTHRCEFGVKFLIPLLSTTWFFCISVDRLWNSHKRSRQLSGSGRARWDASTLRPTVVPRFRQLPGACAWAHTEGRSPRRACVRTLRMLSRWAPRPVLCAAPVFSCRLFAPHASQY